MVLWAVIVALDVLIIGMVIVIIFVLIHIYVKMNIMVVVWITMMTIGIKTRVSKK